MCTVPDCERALDIFSSRRAWTDHEFSQHRRQQIWSCVDCPTQYLDREDFQKHVNVYHTGYTEMEKTLIIDSTESTKTQALRDLKCPFCDTAPGTTIKQFVTHVGRHLEDIALAVLPRSLYSHFESEEDSTAATIESHGSDFTNPREQDFNFEIGGSRYHTFSLFNTESLDFPLLIQSRELEQSDEKRRIVNHLSDLSEADGSSTAFIL